MQRGLALWVVVVAVGASGCGSAPPSAQNEEAISQGSYSVRLLNEGTCQFLACCSSFSTQASGSGGSVCPGLSGYAPGTSTCDPSSLHNNTKHWLPAFACGGSCGASDVYLSGPAGAAPCGQSFTVCFNGTHVAAPIRDHADSNGAWEASPTLYHQINAGNSLVHIYPPGSDAAIANDPECGCPAKSVHKTLPNGGDSCCQPCQNGAQKCGTDLSCGTGMQCGSMCEAGTSCDLSTGTCVCTSCSGQRCGLDHCGTGKLCGGEICGGGGGGGVGGDPCGDGYCDPALGENEATCPEDCVGGGLPI